MSKVYTCDVCKTLENKITIADFIARVRFNEKTVRIDCCESHKHYVTEQCGKDIEKCFNLIVALKQGR
jgi:Fe2+ or Zn2+ uptake regulation protein